MSCFTQGDEQWMQLALQLAQRASEYDEVPVGAIVVCDNRLIGEGYNSPISSHDPSAHAEVNAIRQACKAMQNYRLANATLYTTLEPCAMCAGAIVHARINRVVVASREPRAGAAGSVLNVLCHEQLNHRCHVEFGLLADKSSNILKSFFQQRRQ